MGKLILPLTGLKVVIRKLYQRDIPKLYDLEADPDVKRFVGGVVRLPKDEWVDGMRQLMQSPLAVLPFTILDKESGDFVGRTTISDKDSDGVWEIQILIAKQYWGKRLGREVCELVMSALYRDLGAKSVIAVVDPNNKASRALVEAFGFMHIGVNRTDRWDDGHLIYRHKQAAN